MYNELTVLQPPTEATVADNLGVTVTAKHPEDVKVYKTEKNLC